MPMSGAAIGDGGGREDAAVGDGGGGGASHREHAAIGGGGIGGSDDSEIGGGGASHREHAAIGGGGIGGSDDSEIGGGGSRGASRHDDEALGGGDASHRGDAAIADAALSEALQPPPPPPPPDDLEKIPSKDDAEMAAYLLEELEKKLNSDDHETKITFEEVDAYTAILKAELRLESGEFDAEVVDSLLQEKRWTALVEYLKNSVVFHAGASVVPAPEGATHDVLVVVHAELFLSAHKPHVLELVTLNLDEGAARGYFDEHVGPLRDSVPQERQWLCDRFNELDGIVNGLLPLQPMDESTKEAGTEIKDYMFLYFPELRPPVAAVRGKEQSPLWRYGDKVWRAADGKRGFRCFSCHKVFWGCGVDRLRTHLQGGNTHQGRCRAVQPCTLESLALVIPVAA